MSRFLNQSTAKIFRIGPFLDETDGITPLTGLTIVQGDIQISKNGGAFAQTSDASPTTTHDSDGWYQLPLTTTDTASLGLMTIQVHVATALPVWIEFEVVSANVFDSIIDGSDFLSADVRKVNSITNAAINLGSMYGDAGELIGDSFPSLQRQADRNKDAIESQRSSHTANGTWFYVDPENGNDSNTGLSQSEAVATVQHAHDNLVTDGKHDCIVLLATTAGTPTVLTEAVTLSKSYCFFRGPGRDFLWKRSDNGDTITITGDGIEVSGFQLETHTAGAGHGINITDADFILVKDLWINETRGDGVHILRGSNCQILNNTFQNTGQGGLGQGIDISGTAGSSDNNKVCGNRMDDCAGHGIQITGGTTNKTVICGNNINGCSGFGINIGASSDEALLSENTLINNTSGTVENAGTNTGYGPLVELLASGALTGIDADALVALIWDRVLTAATHNIATSSGRRLRQLSDVVVHSGTAQGAGNGVNQIVLDTGASAIDRTYDPAIVYIIPGGTGEGQQRRILEYEGSTRTATVNRNWATQPDATSEFIIFPDAGGGTTNEGLAQAGDTSTITLNTLASSADGAYVGQIISIVSGLGDDQGRIVQAYDGTTKIATVEDDWDVVPDVTSAYEMRVEGLSCVKAVVNGGKQDVRDSMKLAPSAGAAATDSIDDKIDTVPSDLLADTTVTADGTTTVLEILRDLQSKNRGKIVRDGNTYEYYDTDDTTLLFTFTLADGGRTVT